MVLNGLPRHAGQADAMQALVEIVLVVYLDCAPGESQARIRGDVGGDRAGRSDDTPQMVASKLALFRERTLPLVEYYRARATPILELTVSCDSRADDVRRRIERWWCAHEAGLHRCDRTGQRQDLDEPGADAGLAGP